MKKLLLFSFLFSCLKLSAQTYTLNYDSVRIGKTINSGISISGKLYVKNLIAGNLRLDANGKILHNDTLYGKLNGSNTWSINQVFSNGITSPSIRFHDVTIKTFDGSTGYTDVFNLGDNEAGYHNWMRDALTIGAGISDYYHAYISPALIINDNNGFLNSKFTAAHKTAITTYPDYGAGTYIGLQGYQTDGTEGLYLNLSNGFARLLTTQDSANLQPKLPITVDTLSNKNSVTYDGWAPSLTNSAQSQSMGKVQTLPDGRLFNFFLVNPSITGTTSAAAYIGSRMSADNGMHWDTTRVVYTPGTGDYLGSPDGGMADDGTVSIWFVETNVAGTVRLYKHIYSTDNVNYSTWSAPVAETPTHAGLATTYGNIIKDINGVYIKLIEDQWWAEVWASTDCKTWTRRGFAWDYFVSHLHSTDETSWDYDSVANKWIALCRNERINGGYLMLVSNDGITWTFDGHTNHGIGGNGFLPSPFIMYDTQKQVWHSIASVRRSFDNQIDGLMLYANTTAELVADTLGYMLKKVLTRPIPSPTEFFGYPTLAKLSGGDIIGVFSDQYQTYSVPNNQINLMQAFLYQFTIKYVPEYFGQNLLSDYDINNVVFNKYDGKYEPTPAVDGLARLPLGTGTGLGAYGANVEIQLLKTKTIQQTIYGSATQTITGIHNDATAGVDAFYIKKRTSNGKDTTTLSGDIIYSVRYQGVNALGTPAATTAARFIVTQPATATALSNFLPSKMEFQTSDGNSVVGNALTLLGNKNVGIAGIIAPTARLHIVAGSATAGTAPIKFMTGPLLTTAEVGTMEFLTDKWYGTITTGAARKEYTLNDVALTSGTVPVATTNGRLTNSTVTGTQLGYLSTTTSDVQVQLNSKASLTIVSPTVIRSNATTLSLTYGKDYVFFGTATVWTLPALNGTNITRSDQITIKNAGTGNIVLNSNAGTTIYDSTVLVGTITISPGQAITLIVDGTQFNRE